MKTLNPKLRAAVVASLGFCVELRFEPRSGRISKAEML